MPGGVDKDAARPCARIEADLILLLEGALDALRAEEVNAHLATCRRCAALIRDLRRVLVDIAPKEDDRGVPNVGAFSARSDFGPLADRMERADLGALGRLLYEILKAEFLYDYGDNVEAEAEPIADPAAERARGAALVEDLRDWVDGDRLGEVDLREVAREIGPRAERLDEPEPRLDRLIAGMRAVARYDAALTEKARHYVALAHIKARRPEAALAELDALIAGRDAGLARIASIARAVVPGMLQADPQASVAALEACLCGDPFDGIVHFNLVQAHFEAAGERLTDAALAHWAAARAAIPELVERQLAAPSLKRLRQALNAGAPA